MSLPLPDTVKRFLSEHLLEYAGKGYRITLYPGEKITAGGMTYTGEATAEKLEIAIGGSWLDWLGILAHETCHLDQHIEDPASFDRADSALGRISAWLDGKREDAGDEDFLEILRLESDCEVRTIEKITRHGLPLDAADYARRANAYLMSYGVSRRNRVWIPQPYRNDRLCLEMPAGRILQAEEILSGNFRDMDPEFMAIAGNAARGD